MPQKESDLSLKFHPQSAMESACKASLVPIGYLAFPPNARSLACTIEGQRLSFNVKLLRCDNTIAQSPTFPFDVESTENPRLRQLRERYRLDNVVNAAYGEFDAMTTLQRWVKSRWIWTRATAGALKFEDWRPDALMFLDRAALGGEGFNCACYSVTFIQCLLSLGHQARLIGLCSDVRKWGHTVTEVWSNEMNKWIVIDVDRNLYYRLDGIPLNAGELHDLWTSGRWPEIEVVRQHPLPRETFISRENHFGTDAFQHFYTWRRNDFFSGGSDGNGVSWRDIFNRQMVYLPRKCDGPCRFPGSDEFPDGVWCVARTPEQFYTSLNQTEFRFAPGDLKDSIKVFLRTICPNFHKFLVRDDRSTHWQQANDGTFTWQLHGGINRLWARTQNASGVEGPVSLVELLCGAST